MKRDIDSLLSDFNRQITGPADKIVRQAFGQIVDEKNFDYPDNYRVLREAVDLEATIVASLGKIRQRPCHFSDLTFEAKTTTEGFTRTFATNMANAWSRKLDPTLAQALTAVDTEGLGRVSPYRLSFGVNYSRDGKAQGSDLTLHGAALTPDGSHFDARLFLTTRPGESWKAQTVYSYSETGLVKAIKLPVDPKRTIDGAVDDPETDLRTKNIAQEAGFEWKRIITPVSTTDLPIISAGYIIASRLLQAEQQRR